MKPMKIAGLDIGTTGCKCTVFDENGKYLGSAGGPLSPTASRASSVFSDRFPKKPRAVTDTVQVPGARGGKV